MTKKIKINPRNLIGLLLCLLYLVGCATAPAPILTRSGDADLADLLESIRVKERLPALASAIIIDGNIYATAAVGTRKTNTNNWVTVDDKFFNSFMFESFYSDFERSFN